MATTNRHTEELRTFAHLAGLLAADFPREVLERRLRIIVGERVLEHIAGQALVLTVARLAPRFCHRVDFHAPKHVCMSHLRPLLAAEAFSSESLAALARLIWPDGEFTNEHDAAVDVVLGIGAPGDISVGVDALGAAVSARHRVATVEQVDAVFAALVAAGLGCAQTAKLLYPEILGALGESEIRFAAGPLGDMLEPVVPIVLERPVFAGVGAVGCAAVYALIVAGATGCVLLLDPDVVKDSNLMRYILFDSRHLDMPKVAAAAEIVAAAGGELHVEYEKNILQQYLKDHPEERDRLGLVVSAVDTYEARREITGELPREIVNAGTTPRDFSVSRHGFGDGLACLACIYPPQREDVEIAAVMARELGLEKAEVEGLRRTKQPLTAELLSRIARARGLEREDYAPYVGEPIDSFYNKEVCGTMSVNTRRGEAVAPLAFGSGLAGFLLAKLVAEPNVGDYRRFRMDFGTGLATPMRTNPRQRAECVYCGREVMRAGHAARWGSAAA